MNYIAYLLGIDLPDKDSTGKKSRKPAWWAYLSTMKFAIIILILLGALSLVALFVGELHDPNSASRQPQSTLGAVGRLLFIIFQMDDPFRSWWYRALLGLLTLSLFACVLERTPVIWRLWKKAPDPDLGWVDAAPTAIVRTTEADRAGLESHIQHKWRWRHKDQNVWIGESHRAGMWGPLVTHYGMLFLGVGALVTSFGAITQEAPGYAGDVIHIEGLPYEVRVDSFRIQYYPLQPGQTVLVDGQWLGRLIEKDTENSWAVERWVSEDKFERVSMESMYIQNNWDFERDRGNIQRYVSYVTILDDGKEVRKQEVAVNSPLRIGGYRFYQSSFDPRNPRISARYDSVTVTATDSVKGESHTLNLAAGQSVQIPGDTLTMTAGNLLPNFKLGPNFKAYSEGADFANPALELGFHGKNGFDKSQWTFVKFPSHAAGPGRFTYRVTELKGEKASFEMATVFEVKKTFGTEFLWIGFVLGTLGLILSFYINHRVLYVEWANEHCKGIRLIGLTRKTANLYARDLDRLIEGWSGKDDSSDAQDRVHRPATLKK